MVVYRKQWRYWMFNKPPQHWWKKASEKYIALLSHCPKIPFSEKWPWIFRLKKHTPREGITIVISKQKEERLRIEYEDRRKNEWEEKKNKTYILQNRYHTDRDNQSHIFESKQIKWEIFKSNSIKLILRKKEMTFCVFIVVVTIITQSFFSMKIILMVSF